MTLTPFEFTTLGVVIGYILSCNLTIDEQNSLGNWFELVGQIILTFNAQGSGQESSPSFQDINNLQQQINELKRKCNQPY